MAGFAGGQSSDSANDTTSLKQLSLEQLSALEVISFTKDAVPAFRIPAAISVLTGDQIHQSGVRNLPDLLRLLPGVNVAQVDSSEWAIGIRGFQGALSRSVLVLVDGRSVYTPLFAGVYWDMQDVMLEDIDRIEVIRGPGGTIWGSNAVNGVINIITKNSHSTRGTLVSAGGGNVEQGTLAWRYGGGDDNFSYRVYGKGFTRSPQLHSDNRNFDDWRRSQTGFRLDWQLRGRNELTVQGDVYDGEAGQRVLISTYAPPAATAVEGERSFNGENVMAAWKHTFVSGDDFQFRTYFDRTDRRELGYREIRDTVDADFIYHHGAVKRHDITFGAGVRVSPSDFHQLVPTLDFAAHHQTYNILSAFAQDEIELLRNRLWLTAGSKFEYTTFSDFDYQPSARLTWTPDDKHTVWGAVTRAVRTSSAIEDSVQLSFLNQPDIPSYQRFLGDGVFDPERMVGYELGVRNYVSRRGFVNFALFHNRYSDLLSVESSAAVVETTPGPTHVILPLHLRNGIRANSSGGEATIVWDFSAWWRMRGSYSVALIDAKRAPGSNDVLMVNALEGDSPDRSATASSAFRLPAHFDLDLTLRHVGAVPDQRVPAYTTGDARLGWRAKGPWGFEIAGQNLFQPAHVEYGGAPGPLIAIRRSIYGGITWRRPQ